MYVIEVNFGANSTFGCALRVNVLIFMRFVNKQSLPVIQVKAIAKKTHELSFSAFLCS